MQVFAQNIKEDTLTFSLSVMQQSSVSTSTALNAGNFSDGPTHYKTATKKMTQTDILKAIAYVLHNRAPNFYTSKATLNLVQGELGGFFNIWDSLAQSYADFNPDNSLIGSFNEDGNDGSFYDTSKPNPAYWEMDDGFPDGDTSYDPWTYFNDLETYLDNYARTSIADGTDMYARLDTGRHFLPVPYIDGPNDNDSYDPIATSGQYPPGHMQPWGQIYVKDPGHKDSSGNPLCENVTFFFYLMVQECYDCFYLNSFISDATFTTKQGGQSGPPCCTSPDFLLGKGTDKYYLSLSFDNTINNSYLNPAWVTNRSTDSDGAYYYDYTGWPGVTPSVGVADGTTPDLLVYSDPIRSHLGVPSPYEMRFTLNGIVTYSWDLKMVNASDVAADYVGTANYAANGYGFIGLVCSLITGNATFTEKVVKDIGCCDDEYWWDNEENYASNNGQGNYYTLYSGWYGPGGSSDADGHHVYYFSDYIYGYDHSGNFRDHGYFTPAEDQFNPYPFPNVVGGEVYDTTGRDLPYQNESPNNPQAAITFHGFNNATFHDGYESYLLMGP